MAAIVAAWSSSAVATKVLDLDAVRLQQGEIRKDAVAGTGRYASLPSATRAELISRQDGLLRMLEGKRTTDDLNEVERTEVFNALEWIEAALNEKPEERIVCRRERTIGSNRLTKVCRTVAEEQRQKDEAQRRMRDGGGALGDR